ncbi:hypothetical protein PC9H_002935 [Pleurotus ostreatus]|uniref:Uncharacterized protein n=1 Tax=Pleurotus ostreatus TaxID=5322 RepID=A0A8H7A0H5_PLEOS|nr:uncharacterized protein PC9H_002935 [Pleurotus ostreatus]KAF7436109.1 hypothetical protein PC9H_002935 [Pleurotus ostreatus]KAJ8701744.1 hypothetical protein PTI98_000499 [Pleurotus ostreatus]
MSMLSKVGNSQVYNDGDQRTQKEEEAPRYEAGKPNAHNDLDSKDNRTLSNRQASAEKNARVEETNPNPREIEDPLKPARSHGNEPSRGAKIDAQIQEEEEEELSRKGKI